MLDNIFLMKDYVRMKVVTNTLTANPVNETGALSFIHNLSLSYTPSEAVRVLNLDAGHLDRRRASVINSIIH